LGKRCLPVDNPLSFECLPVEGVIARMYLKRFVLKMRFPEGVYDMEDF